MANRQPNKKEKEDFLSRWFSDPDAYPAAFKSWLASFISGSPNVAFDASQLPRLPTSQIRQAAYTTYAPTWTTTGTAPALGNGTLVGSYIRVGNLVHAKAKLTMGSTTTFGTGIYILSLPLAAVAGDPLLGHAKLLDSSAGAVYLVQAGFNSISSLSFLTSAVPGVFVAATVPFTWAVSDTLDFSVTYEAA